MAERQQDLGNNPESNTEQLHHCPSCERSFEKVEDFPRVFVSDVHIATPDQIPDAIPNWYDEAVLDKPSGQNTTVVPDMVVAYFKGNPNIEEFVSPDGYIYRRPYTQTQRYRDSIAADPDRYKNTIMVGGDNYKRQLNWAPIVKNTLESSQPLQEYLQRVQEMQGQEVRSDSLFPEWEEGNRERQKRWGYTIPDQPELRVAITESRPDPRSQADFEAQQKTQNLGLAEIGLWTTGPNLGSAGGPTISRVAVIGTIAYQGRVNTPH